MTTVFAVEYKTAFEIEDRRSAWHPTSYMATEEFIASSGTHFTRGAHYQKMQPLVYQDVPDEAINNGRYYPI